LRLVRRSPVIRSAERDGPAPRARRGEDDPRREQADEQAEARDEQRRAALEVADERSASARRRPPSAGPPCAGEDPAVLGTVADRGEAAAEVVRRALGAQRQRHPVGRAEVVDLEVDVRPRPEDPRHQVADAEGRVDDAAEAQHPPAGRRLLVGARVEGQHDGERALPRAVLDEPQRRRRGRPRRVPGPRQGLRAHGGAEEVQAERGLVAGDGLHGGDDDRARPVARRLERERRVGEPAAAGGGLGAGEQGGTVGAVGRLGDAERRRCPGTAPGRAAGR
jgi:hypothetical protein